MQVTKSLWLMSNSKILYVAGYQVDGNHPDLNSMSNLYKWIKPCYLAHLTIGHQDCLELLSRTELPETPRQGFEKGNLCKKFMSYGDFPNLGGCAMNWLGRCNDFDIDLKQRFTFDPFSGWKIPSEPACFQLLGFVKFAKFPKTLAASDLSCDTYIYIYCFSIFDYIYKNLVNMLNGKGCTMSKGTANRNTILVISVMIAMISSFTVALLRQVRLNLYRNRLWHCDLHWVRSPTWRGPQNRCCRRSTKQAATNKIGFETISKHTIFIIIRLIYI